jgi:hypothetical protein
MPQTFTDNTGRAWTVPFNVNVKRRVQQLTGVDLLEVIEGKLIEELMSDPEKLVNVIHAVCEPEAKAAGVTDEQFGERLTGDAIDGATAALMEALVDFFPRARRETIRRAVGKAREIETQASAMAIEKIDSLDVQSLLRKALGDYASSSPQSPG